MIVHLALCEDVDYSAYMQLKGFDDLDDWEVNHWLPSNWTLVPQLIGTFSLFQLVGINSLMYFRTS